MDGKLYTTGCYPDYGVCALLDQLVYTYTVNQQKQYFLKISKRKEKT